ncbi:hypothetical protein TanjilG_17240 [Lupinus angustifolius]|uniref:DUF7915 domain-containing protein n=1 Tax=Lupinus angustifolius TaxID=3871 RepID=A0A4P1R194_LUPAN|nr:hypothetical protein TanjilG_17240 [Lupinus angustifolius]
MAPSDVCPTEDAVQAFLEHLVDQLLPAKSSVRDKPTPSQQQLVAKQLLSVVLLYNYYHRKQHPELAYLPFNEFCKLAVVMRPVLLSYMSFVQKIKESDLTDWEKQLSLTEKMIIDSCDISLDASSRSSEVTPGTEKTYIKKRVNRKPTKDELNADDSGFLQVGYSAVKEATGINNTDIALLESYIVYSQSKEKAASRFYIMQCSELIHQKVIQVPIKDIIESLRGPLVKKSCGTWMITPVVDYFHVLPYSEVIFEWISREAFSNSLQHSCVTRKNIMDSPEVTESYENEDTFIALDSKPSSYNIDLLKQEENNGRFTLGLSDHVKDRRDIDLDKSSILKSRKKEKCRYIPHTEKPGEDQDKNTPIVQYCSNGSTTAVKNTSLVLSTKDACAGRNDAQQSHQPPSPKPFSVNYHQHQSTSLPLSAKDACAGRNEAHQSHQPPSLRPLSVNFHQGEKVDTTKMLVPVGRPNILAPYDMNCTKRHNTSSDVEKLQVLLDTTGNLLSQAALSALMRKRNELALQQREIEDEIVMCDKTIQRLLTGGVHADVTVKGLEFECSCRGNVCSGPREARESAAAQMLANLRNIAKPVQ